MTAISSTAGKLAEAGLLRQAAAANVDTLLGSFDGMADDIVDAAADALGSTRMSPSVRAGELTLHFGAIDSTAALRGDAGQSLADAIAGVRRLTAEVDGYARVVDDATITRHVDNASDDLRAAEQYVRTSTERAREVAVGGPAAETKIVVDGEFPLLRTGTNHWYDETAAKQVRTAVRDAQYELRLARALAQQSNARIPAFEHVDGIARSARAAAAQGPDIVATSKPLAEGIESLLAVTRDAHTAGIRQAFSLHGQQLRVDVAAVHRQVDTGRRAIRHAQELIEELGTTVSSSDEHLYVRELVAAAQKSISDVRTATKEWSDLADVLYRSREPFATVTDRGLSTASSTIRDTGRRVSGELTGLLSRFGRDKVSKAVQRDLDGSLERIIRFDDRITEPVRTLRGTLTDLANGQGEQSLLGAGTHVAVEDALAAVRNRYGSAEELQAALQATVG